MLVIDTEQAVIEPGPDSGPILERAARARRQGWRTTKHGGIPDTKA
jgi:hypothetical protein